MSQTNITEASNVQAGTMSVEHIGLKRKHIGARAFIGTFGASIFILLCTILQGIIVARLLGPSGRGELAAVILWPTVISCIGLFGCDRVVTRRMGKEIDIFSTINNSFWLVLVLSVLSILVGFVIIPQLISKQYYHVLGACLLFLIFIPINQLNKLFMGIERGRGNFKRFNFLRSLVNPVTVLGIITLLMTGYISLKGVIIVYLTGNSLPCIIRLYLFRHNLLNLPKLKNMLSVLREGILFGIQSAINEIYLRLDIFLVLWFLSPKDLGFYTIAMSSTYVLYLITESSGMVAFAKCAQVTDKNRFRDAANAFRICLLLKVVAGAILFFMLSFLIPAFYGSDFIPSIAVAQILLVGNILFGLGKLLDECLLGYGYPGRSIAGRIMSSMVLLITGSILVRPLGLSGIAYSYVVSRVVFGLWNLISLIRGVDEASVKMMFPKWKDIVLVAQRCGGILCRYRTQNQRTY